MPINEAHELLCRCPVDEKILAQAGVDLPPLDRVSAVNNAFIRLENENARLRDELRATTDYANALKDLCLKQRKERRRLKVLLENYGRTEAV